MPASIEDFCNQLRPADGMIISSPEYVRAIPGGLKNAIDCLRELRVVQRTVSQKFDGNNFVRFPLMSKSPDEIRDVLMKP